MFWFLFGAVWALASAIVIDEMFDYDPEEIDID